jgi:4-amino-4-deoxy-L-arabinose transferase-like glycosyltransferase
VSGFASIVDALSCLRDSHKRVIIRTVRELLRRNVRFFIGGSLAALILRLLLVFRFPAVVDDSRLYADIAKNWLQHGIYGITNSGSIMPTLSRLPGYPAFLAGIFAIFGTDNFRAVLMIQALFDLATCFLIADMARRLFSDHAAKAAFLLAAMCPFLANYAAAALTETLEIFFTALALDFAFAGLGIRSSPARPLALWLGCGLAIAGAILLRPDGGILLGAIGGYLIWNLLGTLRSSASKKPGSLSPRALFLAGVIVAVGALAPLMPWTLRNLHTLHKFEPLAPRYANDSDEPLMPGFNRWVKTWTADYVSVQEIYWNVPGEEIDAGRLPLRAFDSPQQRELTAQIFADYNRDHDLTPELDTRFANLAAERIHASALRYYVWLPTLRITGMWLRPRTELTSADPRWWEFNDDRRLLALSLGFGFINLLYVGLGLAGAIRAREFFGVGLFVLFLVVRSAFLGTLENPEPRYTLECFPAVIVLAAGLFHRIAPAAKPVPRSYIERSSET